MRNTLLLPLIVAVPLLGGGCGSHRDRVSAIIASDIASSAEIVALPHAQANGRQVPLSTVQPLVPSPMPRPLPQPGGCEAPASVTIRFASGRSVRYGPCRRPQAIDWLRAAMVGEARQWQAPAARRTTISGATSAERRALRRILRTMAPTRIRAVRLRPVADRKRWQLTPGDVTLTIEAGPSLRGAWEAELFADEYAAVADQLHLREVGLVATAAGTSRPGMAPSTVSSTQLGLLRQQLTAMRAPIVELRHQDDAIAVTLRTNDPAAFLKQSGQRLLQSVRSVQAEALYAAIEDRKGAIVYAWGELPAEGMLWTRPDLDACGPISHSTPFNYRTPPCRA